MIEISDEESTDNLQAAIDSSLRDERLDSNDDGVIENAVDNIVGDSGSDNVPKEFICAVCMEMFYQPSTLLCQHTFCKGCLKSITTTNSRHKCPQCNAKFPFPAEHNRVLDDALRRMFPEIHDSRRVKSETILKARSMDEQIRDEIYRAVLNDEVSNATSRQSRVGETVRIPHHADTSIPSHPSRYNIWELAVPNDISDDEVTWYLNAGRGYGHLCTFAAIVTGSMIADRASDWCLPGHLSGPIGSIFRYSLGALGVVTAFAASRRAAKFVSQANRILNRKTENTASTQHTSPLELLARVLSSRANR